jgi:hypothetical protein
MTNSNYDILAGLLSSEYEKYFPKSKVNISWGFDKRSIFVKLYIAQNKDETINHIMDNDMLNILFSIEQTNNESAENDYILENHHKSYHITPDSQYMAYSSRKLSFRKSTGDMMKTVESFGRFLASLKKSLQEDLTNGRIHNNHIELLRQKLSD